MPRSNIWCNFCGTANRISGFSLAKIPWCGKCGKPLPEPFYVWSFRPFYRFPRIAIMVVVWAFLLWAGHESLFDGLSMSLSCSVRQEPAQGIYGRYTNLPRTVPLTIVTPAGSNYFVKLAEPKTDASMLSLFVHGGEPLTAKVPLGSFILRAASGDRWCGEANLFGGNTHIVEAGRTVEFLPNEIHTITLSPQADGNLPIRTIGRGKF